MKIYANITFTSTESHLVDFNPDSLSAVLDKPLGLEGKSRISF